MEGQGNQTMAISVPGHEPEPEPGQTRALGVASQVYVISLLERQDRREQMERLRGTLGISWMIIDATSFTDPLVYRLFDWIVLERKKLEQDRTTFRWPREIDALSVLTDQPLLASGSELWTIAPLPESITPSSPSSVPYLICAAEDFAMPPEVYDFLILTPARVACWDSHVSAMRTFVDRVDAKSDDVAIILEDDVDMEKDIADRLSVIWKDLPAGWDIVLLGHCWSDEAFYAPVATATEFMTRLHPSNSPKCTHGYALSLSGARRLLQHLRYPPFAYSRSIDTAFSWLIESGRLRAYSVVPSVVVQMKMSKSDILPGSGSSWKDKLVNGVFGS